MAPGLLPPAFSRRDTATSTWGGSRAAYSQAILGYPQERLSAPLEGRSGKLDHSPSDRLTWLAVPWKFLTNPHPPHPHTPIPFPPSPLCPSSLLEAEGYRVFPRSPVTSPHFSYHLPQSLSAWLDPGERSGVPQKHHMPWPPDNVLMWPTRKSLPETSRL